VQALLCASHLPSVLDLRDTPLTADEWHLLCAHTTAAGRLAHFFAPRLVGGRDLAAAIGPLPSLRLLRLALTEADAPPCGGSDATPFAGLPRLESLEFRLERRGPLVGAAAGEPRQPRAATLGWLAAAVAAPGGPAALVELAAPGAWAVEWVGGGGGGGGELAPLGDLPALRRVSVGVAGAVWVPAAVERGGGARRGCAVNRPPPLVEVDPAADGGGLRWATPRKHTKGRVPGKAATAAGPARGRWAPTTAVMEAHLASSLAALLPRAVTSVEVAPAVARPT